MRKVYRTIERGVALSQEINARGVTNVTLLSAVVDSNTGTTSPLTSAAFTLTSEGFRILVPSNLLTSDVTNIEIRYNSVAIVSLEVSLKAAETGTGGAVADGSISTAKIADGAVTAAKVATDVATQSELDAVASSKANTTHVHSASDLNAGTLPLARGGTGATDAAGARTSLGLGTAAIVNTGTTTGTVPVLGASGTLAIARLATGTPDGTKFVRDDGTLVTPTAAGSPADVQTFTSSGTWTKPVGARLVKVFCRAGGGGGGAGGTAAALTAIHGGGGGGGGGWVEAELLPADLGATVSVTVGLGGSAGASVSSNGATGGNGTVGGDSSFGNLVRAQGGGAGQGGSTVNGYGGAIYSGLLVSPGANSATSAVSNAPSQLTTDGSGNPYPMPQIVSTGGGAGGGIDAADVPRAGGTGGPVSMVTAVATSNGGVVGGALPSNGAGVGSLRPAGGAGGGAASITAAAQAGGAGGFPGGGGGGGGAARNGFASGAGGAGGNGVVVVVTSF